MMSVSGSLRVLIFAILFIKNSFCYWGGGWGLGNGFQSGYNPNSYGYGTRRQQGILGGGHQYQPLQYNNNNHGYYQDPVPVRSTFQQQQPLTSLVITPQTTTTTPAPAFCNFPHARDPKFFHQSCIFPEEVSQTSCSSRGAYLPTGTTAVTSCKPPEYYSENGEMILEVCRGGMWFSDGKSLKCVSVARKPHDHPTSHNAHDHHQPVSNTNYDDSVKVPHNDSIYFPQWNHTYYTTASTTTTPRPYWAWLPTESTTTTEATTTTTPRPYWAWVPTESTTTTEATTTRPYWAWTPWTSTTEATTTTTTTLPTTTTTTTPTTTTSTTTVRPYIYDIDDRSLQPTCPPLTKHAGVQLHCTSKVPLPWAPSSFVVTEDECETAQPVGTEATYQCKQYYEATSALKTMYRKCREGGTWSGSAEMFSCTLECGVANPVGQAPLITNGEPTYKAQWPWHAAIFLREGEYNSTYQYICGATLINKRVLLTAGHCVTSQRSATVKDANLFKIDLGRYERTQDDEFVQSIYAEEIIVHPDYNPNSFDSDIAMIILKESVSIGYHVRPICYPQQQNAAFEEMQLASGSIGTVVGFGRNEANVEVDTLRMAHLKVVSSKECAISFADTTFGSTLAKSTTFCAGLGNGTNVCTGDSGGGIYFSATTIQGSRWYLRGLVSVGVQIQEGGIKKCDPTRHSIFTKISPYADWIARILSLQDFSAYF